MLILEAAGQDPYMPATFWVNAVGTGVTVLSVIVALFYSLSAWTRDRRKAKQAEENRREAEALELHPGPGVMWWLVRPHEPSITVSAISRLRMVGAHHDLEGRAGCPLGELQTGTRYGLGVGLRPGDFVEVYWTDSHGNEFSNGVRITDSNKIHYLRNANDAH